MSSQIFCGTKKKETFFERHRQTFFVHIIKFDVLDPIDFNFMDKNILKNIFV